MVPKTGLEGFLKAGVSEVSDARFNWQPRKDEEMKSKLQQIGEFAAPALLMSMMAGCASVSDLEKVQKQVDELKATAQNANAVATSAIASAEESKVLASDARNTARAASATSATAEQASAEASALAAAAAKNSEAAAGAAVEAEKTVKEASVIAAEAAKKSEAAAGAAVEAEKTVKAATITFPVMRFDPATGRFFLQWLTWPSMTEYTGTPPAAAPANGK
jgi:ABC-type transporter Mla subunit MlaD